MPKIVSRRKPPTPSSSGLSAARNLALMAASSVSPSVRATVRAAQAAKGAYSAGKVLFKGWNGNKSRHTQTRRVRGSAKWNNTSTGAYGGRFKKPRKVKNSIFTQSLRSGYKMDVEEFGRIEDPDSVYIGHSTKHIVNMTTAIVGALLRKLFVKAGYPIGDRFDELALFSWNNSDGFKIEYVVKNGLDSGEVLSVSVSIGDNQSFQSLMGATGAGTMGAIAAQMANFIKLTDKLIPHKLILYMSDRNAVETNWRMASSINVGYERMHLASKSTLTVQNRTAGANAVAADKSSERVDNQPLEGTLFEFNQATPKLKFMALNPGNQRPLNSFVENGLRLVRSAVLDNSMQNAPDPKIWSNCNKKSKVLIQPGSMKKTVLFHKYESSLLTFLQRIQNFHTEGTDMTGGSGKSQFLQLQETLRTTSSNPVTVQYERHLEIGCYFKSTKVAPIKANLIVSEQNDLPA